MSNRLYFPRDTFDYRSEDIETGVEVPVSPTQLENHAVSRARMALVAGVDLALLAAHTMVQPSAVLRKVGARYQDDGGNDKDKTRAAHALPCGILINNARPHELPALHGRPSLQKFIIEPYRYTNIVPKAVNDADHRAEAFNRNDGTGLVANFVTLCGRLLSSAANSSGKLDRANLQLAFNSYTEDCGNSFRIALSRDSRVETPSEFIVPKDSQADVDRDNIRTALHIQELTLRRFGPSMFSRTLVEQVESDFHSVRMNRLARRLI
jgi:hypothetical protein